MASPWFQVTPVAPGVTMIVEPHVHRFFRANLYRIAGRDFDIQLDFGVGVQSLAQAMGDGDRPIMAIASHAHVDHVGSFFEYPRRAGHPIEADFFAAMADQGTLASYFKGEPEALAVPPSPTWSMADYALTPAPLTEMLQEGDVVDLGNRKFSVLHLPGHSPGSIALLDEHNGDFFSADAIYDGGLVDDIPGADITTYIQTMRRLAELDVGTVYAGHCDSFDKKRMWQIASGYIEAQDAKASASR